MKPKTVQARIKAELQFIFERVVGNHYGRDDDIALDALLEDIEEMTDAIQDEQA